MTYFLKRVLKTGLKLRSETEKRICFLILIGIFLLVTNIGLIGISSATEQAEGHEVQISLSRYFDQEPDIDGQKIVWASKTGSACDIILFDIATLSEKNLNSDEANQISPEISGDNVVYLDDRNAEDQMYSSWFDIYMYDLKNNVEIPVCLDPSWQGFIEIDGNNIVWTDGSRIIYRDSKGNPLNVRDIYSYNIDTKMETPLITKIYGWGKDISGDLLVYEEFYDVNDWVFGTGNSDIFTYNLTTSIKNSIAPNDYVQRDPRIDKTNIIWVDKRNGNDDIYYFNLITGQEKQITTNQSVQNNPAISGNIIVWQDWRNGNADIYIYNLDTGQEESVCINEFNQTDPKISGNIIVWEDERNYYTGNSRYDVYAYILGEEENLLRANFSGNTTSGIAPLTVEFKDESAKPSTNILWDFGDVTNSTDRNPVHTYNKAGNYSVLMTISSPEDIDRAKKTNYIQVKKPAFITIVAAGDQAYDIGEEVLLSGTSTASSTTYLFITGPGLPTNGVKLEDLSIAAITGQQGTFTTTPVYSDKTWEYSWDTGALSGTLLSPGIYTIYAVSEPNNNASLASAIYSDVSVLFRSGQQLVPFPSSTNPPTDPDGDGVYEDTNGNGRKDFNDIVIFFRQMTWVSQNEPIECFDFNGNGRLDFNDVVLMFQEM